MEKLIITVATTGGGTTKKQQPNLPITPEEIVHAAIESYNEGASIAHIHVRDPKTGLTSHDPNLYREVVERIRENTDMIINLTTATGARIVLQKLVTGEQVIISPQKRCEPLVLKPEICSLDIGTMNFGDSIFATTIPHGEEMAKIIMEAGVKPEVEIFDAGHIDIAKRLIDKDLIKKPAHFQLCMGVMGGISASPKNLLYLAESLPPDSTWSVLGIGLAEFPMIGLAMLMGGHVRVGFEDNIYIKKGVLAQSNAQLVKKAVEMALILGREIATPKEAREILRLGNM
jgi:uncharacterized protein (DUF849 family)